VNLGQWGNRIPHKCVLFSLQVLGVVVVRVGGKGNIELRFICGIGGRGGEKLKGTSKSQLCPKGTPEVGVCLVSFFGVTAASGLPMPRENMKKAAWGIYSKN